MYPVLQSLLFLVVAASAVASEIPACTPLREGAVAYLDGKLCACRHEPGGSITGRRPGSRWDCGPLRPACGPAPPADLGGEQPQQPLPFLPMPPPTGWR